MAIVDYRVEECTYLSSPASGCETRRLRKEMFTREAEPSLALPPEALCNLKESFGRQCIGEGNIGSISASLFFGSWERVSSSRKSSIDSFKSSCPFNYLTCSRGRAIS